MRTLRRVGTACCGPIVVWLAVLSPPASARQMEGGRRLPAAPALPSAIAPVEVVAADLGLPMGVAVSDTGVIVFSDERSGAVLGLAASGAPTPVLAGLQGPAGVAFDQAGRLLVVESRTGRVLRHVAPGLAEPWAVGLDDPGWIAAGANGEAWVTVRGLGEPGGSGGVAGGRRLAHIDALGAATQAARGFVGLQGVALDAEQGVIVALRQLLSSDDRRGTRLALLPLGPDHRLGAPVRLMDGGPAAPVGVALDRLGEVVMTAAPSAEEDEARERGGTGVVLLRRNDGEVITLATGLRDPRGLAFEPEGHLLVVERGHGRLLRLRATPAPVVDAPAFTTQATLALVGSAQAGARIDVFADASLRTRVGGVTADAATGAFVVALATTPNAVNRWWVVASANAGRGLPSVAVPVVVQHDDRAPDVTVDAPAPGVLVSAATALRARASDEGSGVARVEFHLDAELLATVAGAEPTQPLLAEAWLDPRLHAEGPHVLTAEATDRAGNHAAASVPFTLDRTPPDTLIVSGPDGPVTGAGAVFVVLGRDAVSDTFDYSWRVDAGVWSPFAADARIIVRGTASGAHRFEVKARDRAGLEDPTPAAQPFTVGGFTIAITEPASGALIAGPGVWVRGVVLGAAGEVGVTLPLPLEQQAMLGLEAIPAATEGGRFVAEWPVVPGATSITVVARDQAGSSVSASVPITVSESPAPPVGALMVAPAAGFAPLAVEMSVRGAEGSQLEMDQDGDGVADFMGPTLDGQSFVYAAPGVYLPALRELTPSGSVVMHRAMVEVYDRARLEARVQAVWSGFVDALSSGSVAGAVGFIHSGRREQWRADLGQLPPEGLAEARTMFPPVALVGVDRGAIECEMMRDVDGLRYSYPVTFRLDVDGQWRLWQF